MKGPSFNFWKVQKIISQSDRVIFATQEFDFLGIVTFTTPNEARNLIINMYLRMLPIFFNDTHMLW